MRILVATGKEVLFVEARSGDVRAAEGLDGRAPTCLAVDRPSGRAWCGTARNGVLTSEDGGLSWTPAGLDGEKIMSVAVSPTGSGVAWVGTEPSALWSSEDGGESWEPASGLLDLPSSSQWSFPPWPDTHHVRWIACDPRVEGRLWLAIEAGALVSTPDGGNRWRDRVSGGPYDTHELAIHPEAPNVLRVAAGDGYYESRDAGETWASSEDGLEVGYLRSVAIDPGDPETVLVSASSHAHSAYMAGRADGRVYRRVGGGAWERASGWPDPARTIAPLLVAGLEPGSIWAADERGLLGSSDGGRSFELAAAFEPTPSNLRGVAVVG